MDGGSTVNSDSPLVVPLVVREVVAARLLGVSVAALRRWRRERRGPPFVRLERCVGYPVADLEAFVATNTVTNPREINVGQTNAATTSNHASEVHNGR
jgi:hypothetical protein